MKTILSQIPFVTLLIYLSFNGIEIASKQYWIVSALVVLSNAASVATQGRK